MSVGGVVVGVTIKGDEARVTTVERRRRGGLDYMNATSVWVKRAGHRIALGDMLWWQGRRAFWTPQENRERPESKLRQGIDFDVPLERTSYSHSGVGWPGRED